MQLCCGCFVAGKHLRHKLKGSSETRADKEVFFTAPYLVELFVGEPATLPCVCEDCLNTYKNKFAKTVIFGPKNAKENFLKPGCIAS